MHKVGEIIRLEGSGRFSDGLRCEILEVYENGRIKKMKSLVRDEALGRMGFIKEGDDYVCVEWSIMPN